MKSLSLSIELSNLALETACQNMSQDELLGMVQDVLLDYTTHLGRFTGSSEQQKSLGDDLLLSEYQFDYEEHSVQVQLANFVPRGDWHLQGVRLV